MAGAGLLDMFPDLPEDKAQAVLLLHEGDVERAVEFLLTSGDDIDTALAARQEETKDPVAQLMMLGLDVTKDDCAAALRTTGGNTERAVAVLLGNDLEDIAHFARTRSRDSHDPFEEDRDFDAEAQRDLLARFGSKEPPPPRALLDDGALNDIIDRCDRAIKEVEEKLAQPDAVPPPLSSVDQEQLVWIFDEMIERFGAPLYQRKYAANKSDTTVLHLPAGEPVPQYFANVVSGSIWYRKVLSMAGLRNLILYGREIFQELKETMFTSDPGKYNGGTGLAKMKNLTGNVVDLDTIVLRCSDPVIVRTINAVNRTHGEPEYPDGDTFGSSPQAKDIARAAAEPVLQGFADELKLKDKQRRQRRLVLDPTKDIPIATGNCDRGKWPVWQYINQGVNSYHANAPNLPDVIGALLRAPFAAATAYIHCRGDDELLNSFYEDGIVDSCFNAKWKALEEFNITLDKSGGITKVLEEIQASHQGVFTALFDTDDDNHTQEKAEMWRLANGKRGRDKTGLVRDITEPDVIAWVDNPQAPL